MKKSHHMILTLTLVGVFSSAALVGVFIYTEPLIKANQEKALKKAIFQVLPEVENFKTITKGKETIYQGLDSAGHIVGYAFVGKGPGYQGIIKIMIGVDSSFEKTLNIEILESVETPGLGQKIDTPSFRHQFQGLHVIPFIQLVKKEPTAPGKVQSITGATISSQTVVDIVNAAIARAKSLLVAG